MAREPRRTPWVERRSLGRRHTDRKWPRHLRDFWLLAVTGLVLLALNDGLNAITQVQHARRTATAVQCAILSAVSEGGRTIIARSSTQETPFTRTLERLGYPPLAVRRQQATVAGQQYVAGISQRVDQKVGHRGDGLINRDGTVNCAKLAQLVDIQPVKR